MIFYKVGEVYDMMLYSKRSINGISFIFTFIISLIFIFIGNLFPNSIITPLLELGKRSDYIQVQLEINPIEEETKEENSAANLPDESTTSSLLSTKEKEMSDWYLEIPVISLKATIQEGTSKEVMDSYIGHFEETDFRTGNVGLAAHNRGYPVNYFAKLKQLKLDDVIVYHYQDFHCTYRVVSQQIIHDTDWTTLATTDKNTITLITCVENEPEYRRCVQAVQE